MSSAPLHPLDRPLADLTLEVRADRVRATVMINFRFIDLILECSGDPRKTPSESEIASIQARMHELFAQRNGVELDGRLVAPSRVGDCIVSEPLPVLRQEAPDFVRALTQIRFEIDYPMPEAARELAVHWSFYPEHPLTDDVGSPMVPMRLRAVVVQDSGAKVLEFHKDAKRQTLALDARPDAPASASASAGARPEAPAGTPTDQRSSMPKLWIGGGLALLFAAFLATIFTARKRRGALVACLALGLLATSCSNEGATIEAATKSWKLSVAFSPATVPVNEHFTARVEVSAKAANEAAPPAIRANADMPAHGHGMNTEPRVTKLEDGVWRVEGLLFHMPGKWELYLDVGEGAALERATIPIEI